MSPIELSACSGTRRYSTCGAHKFKLEMNGNVPFPENITHPLQIIHTDLLLDARFLLNGMLEVNCANLCVKMLI